MSLAGDKCRQGRENRFSFCWFYCFLYVGKRKLPTTHKFLNKLSMQTSKGKKAKVAEISEFYPFLSCLLKVRLYCRWVKVKVGRRHTYSNSQNVAFYSHISLAYTFFQRNNNRVWSVCARTRMLNYAIFTWYIRISYQPTFTHSFLSAELINFASFLYTYFPLLSRAFYDRFSQSVASLALDIDFLCQMIGNDWVISCSLYFCDRGEVSHRISNFINFQKALSTEFENLRISFPVVQSRSESAPATHSSCEPHNTE